MLQASQPACQRQGPWDIPCLRPHEFVLHSHFRRHASVSANSTTSSCFPHPTCPHPSPHPGFPWPRSAVLSARCSPSCSPSLSCPNKLAPMLALGLCLSPPCAHFSGPNAGVGFVPPGPCPVPMSRPNAGISAVLPPLWPLQRPQRRRWGCASPLRSLERPQRRRWGCAFPPLCSP